MLLPDWLNVYGDLSYRGPCPQELVEQISIVNQIRRLYPDTYGRIAVHIRNEGARTHSQVVRHKAEGMTKGAPDLVIPGAPAFLCEIKRQNSQLSRVSKEQLEYLEAAHNAGAFVCVAFGAKAAWEGFEEWRIINEKK